MAFRRVLLSHLSRSRHSCSSLSPHHVSAPSTALVLPQSRLFSTPTDLDSQTVLGGGGGLDLGQDMIGASHDSLTRHVISLLDSYHDLTGLPWWVVIASSTVAFRTALLPVLILQRKQTKTISQFLPKLPPFWPPKGSGRSVVEQLMLFRNERKALGCPSFFWIPAYFSIQISCFFMWITSIRRMSLDHHPGFDTGGTLWFQNLTEIPNGLYGPIFPFLIAALHYTNTRIAFSASSVHKVDKFAELAKTYKIFLNFLTFALYFLAFQMPQGSLLYWSTNLSFSIAQQSIIKHPVVSAKLGLQGDDTVQKKAGNPMLTNIEEAKLTDSSSKGGLISGHDLTPKELVALSAKYLSGGQKEKSIPLLRLALEKDPEYLQAMVILGQALYQKEQFAEAAKYLERAASKLIDACPTEVEEVDLLIVASQWAGVSNIRQGKTSEGITHLERVANMEEPDDPKSKAHYLDALVLYSSAIFNEGRREEAAKCLRRVVAYDPSFQELLKQCEEEDDSIPIAGSSSSNSTTHKPL
ncbi:ALBINO3-like protein 3 [Raphanus sativus]|uniref:ALBINO3-like protein 3, mitochondrial n=1 Tax=Raphanus sativus TaxID=3726 RepID=A0A6J0JFQ7_RAPSA|nr:ALBINO3-like protein 3, mitochondrial [Raphanus sativus]KAJ4890560.1 ALBINO3-like protein 3 [Raphanus sativus]